jgi:hypothetical protein
MSDRDLGRTFRRNMKFGHELEKALKQLEREDHISRASRQRSRGPAAEGWKVVDAGGVDETCPKWIDEMERGGLWR